MKKQSFGSIVGNSTLKQKLTDDILSDSLSHAYVIEGKKGSGKHTIALMIAAALSCEKRDSANHPLPCLDCPTCKKILDNNCPDIIKINRGDKATLTIDPIRFLRNDVRMVPNDLEHKVYIIEDAHLMNEYAQNAFLLTLEEPPSYVKFFLLCEDTESLLETIKSRVQILRTEPICCKDIDNFLQENYESAQRLKLSDPDAYGELIMACDNSIGRAIELLDSKNFSKVAQDRSLARNIVSAIISARSSDSASLIAKFDAKRDGVTEQLKILETAIRDLIVICKSENAPLLFFHDRDEAISLADSTNIRYLFLVYDEIKKAQSAISLNSNVKLTLVSLFSRMNIL